MTEYSVVYMVWWKCSWILASSWNLDFSLSKWKNTQVKFWAHIPATKAQLVKQTRPNNSTNYYYLSAYGMVEVLLDFSFFLESGSVYCSLSLYSLDAANPFLPFLLVHQISHFWIDCWNPTLLGDEPSKVLRCNVSSSWLSQRLDSDMQFLQEKSGGIRIYVRAK